MLIFNISFFLFFCLCLTQTQKQQFGERFDNFIGFISTTLKSLQRTVIESYYYAPSEDTVSNKCTILKNLKTQAEAEGNENKKLDLSYSGCYTDRTKDTCPADLQFALDNSGYQLNHYICGECTSEWISSQASSVETFSFQENVYTNQDILFSKMFDTNLHNAYESFKNLDNLGTEQKDDIDQQHALISLSLMFSSGVHRLFPGRFSRCSIPEEDEKAFIATAAGPINLIIMLDISGSMGFNAGWRSAVKYAHRYISSLSSDSYGQIVYFNNDCFAPFSEDMKRGTTDNIANFQSSVCKQSKGGGTKFRNAFKYAFHWLFSSL